MTTDHMIQRINLENWNVPMEPTDFSLETEALAYHLSLPSLTSLIKGWCERSLIALGLSHNRISGLQ